MTSELIKEWHPLDGVPAPDYIPPCWDGPHVSKRMCEALRILARVSFRGVQLSYGSAWPSYSYEWQDQLAQAQAEPAQQQQDAQSRNFSKVIPSSEEIMRMEQAIGWPAHYLVSFPQLLRVVQAVALSRSRYRDMHVVARRLGLPHHLVRQWNREGLDVIAIGLVRDKVRVF